MLRRSQGVRVRLAIGFLLGTAPGWWAVGCQFPDYGVNDRPTGGGAGAGGKGGASGEGGAGDSGGDGGGGGDEPRCTDAAEACAPALPAGFRGPVAFWDGKSAETPPVCPDGYAEPQDVYGDLSAAPAECLCTCTATGQSCGAAQVTLFNDTACDATCAEASVAACMPAAGCNGSVGSLRAPVLAPSGGSCRGTVEKIVQEAAWKKRARLCERAGESEACAAGGTCVTSPRPPFASQVCVYRLALEGEPAPSCPSGYPRGPTVFYTELTDSRACGECACEGPNGGRCDARVLLSTREDCSEGFEYEVGSGCAPYQLGDTLTHLKSTSTLTEGTCAASGNAEPIGEAAPAGNPWIVCCAE